MKRALLKTQFTVLLLLLISNASFGQGWSKVAMVDSEHESRPTTFVIDDSIYMGRGDTGFFSITKLFGITAIIAKHGLKPALIRGREVIGAIHL